MLDFLNTTYRSGICLIALSETPHNGMWDITNETVVEIGTVAKDSPLHRYSTIMLRALLLVGVRGYEVTAEKVKDVEDGMVSPAAAASATTSDKRHLEWDVLEECARQQGELHPVGRPHVNSDRQLWIRWDDVPTTFRKGYDYMTPRQIQLLSKVRAESVEDSKRKMGQLLTVFQKNVSPKFSQGCLPEYVLENSDIT